MLLKAKEGSTNDVNLKKSFADDDFGKGVILYLKNDVLVGCLMWNVFKKVPIARQVCQKIYFKILNLMFLKICVFES